MDAFTLEKIEFDAVRRILAGFCSCSLGKQLAGGITPSRKAKLIDGWLRQVSDMVDAVRGVGLPPLGGVTDVSAELARARPGGDASGEDLARIASVLDGAAQVRAYLHALPEKLETLHELAAKIGNFDRQVEAIRAVVESGGRIRDDASRRLAEIRREIDATSQHIHDVIHGYLRSPEVAKLLQNPTVTLHGDRYVLPVKATNRGRLPGVVHRASASGATVFVEPNASVELNNHLADLYQDERSEVYRLINELVIQLTPHTNDMLKTLAVLAQVDLISGKAQYAYQFNMVCPKILAQGPLQLDQARHPLLIHQAWHQEREGVAPEDRHAVVPIDVRLGSDFDLLVITGSNTGGKTVTLKTVALLVVMAQSGMHIPAQRGATMPIFDDVCIDIGDEQSLEQSLSTFGGHVKRLDGILRRAAKDTLVLLDELGAGTDPDEGGAIGQAVLDELLRIGCLGMITTHLSVLKAYACNHDRVDNASVEFDTVTLSPTYRLHVGTPGESHAITVAERLGLPHRVTDAARKHLNTSGRQFRRAIRATGRLRRSAEEARAEAQSARLSAQSQQETYQDKLDDLKRLQEEFETWLATLPDWQPGHEIHIPSLNKKGRLVRLQLHRQIAVVDADNVQVEVPLRELMPDLGQNPIRRELADLRKQIQDQARQSKESREEAAALESQRERGLKHQRERAKQFDTWLAAIGRLRVGQDVPIARKPGRGKVLKVDLLGLRATVQTDHGELELSIQDLFPQTGPFAHEEAAAAPPRRPRGRSRKAPEPDQPIPRRSPDSRASQERQRQILSIPVGSQVYVVPFRKRATLIRINAGKKTAIVESGAFEMEVPLADLEPLKDKPTPRGGT